MPPVFGKEKNMEADLFTNRGGRLIFVGMTQGKGDKCSVKRVVASKVPRLSVCGYA